MKRQMILGTDWWTDCDDAVALRLLARAHVKGEVQLLGVVINACMEYSVASLRGFLDTEGVGEVPIGIDLAATDFGGAPPYQRRLATNFRPEMSNRDAEDAVRLYRRLLSEATEPVEMLEIGFLQAVRALLDSPPDEISPKTGCELVREKVKKLWVMAGKWDGDGERENNFARNERARVAAAAFCRTCPVPVTFLGFEVGCDVVTGKDLREDDPLYGVLSDFGSPQGRESWDPMLVMLALIGDEAAAGYRTVRGTASVDPLTGFNYFVRSDGGPHAFVVKQRSDEYYENYINSRL